MFILVVCGGGKRLVSSFSSFFEDKLHSYSFIEVRWCVISLQIFYFIYTRYHYQKTTTHPHFHQNDNDDYYIPYGLQYIKLQDKEWKKFWEKRK